MTKKMWDSLHSRLRGVPRNNRMHAKKARCWTLTATVFQKALLNAMLMKRLRAKRLMVPLMMLVASASRNAPKSRRMHAKKARSWTKIATAFQRVLVNAMLMKRQRARLTAVPITMMTAAVPRNRNAMLLKSQNAKARAVPLMMMTAPAR
jgi:hypothetical protein